VLRSGQEPIETAAERVLQALDARVASLIAAR
jgi:hypothetical protein